MMMRQNMNFLGLKVRDRVTGFTGIVSTVAFDLYGCVQAIVTPEHKPGVKPEDNPQHWFDIKRLETLSADPVMTRPDFAQPEIGAAEKPRQPSRPIP